jgi:hypothetical protein
MEEKLNDNIENTGEEVSLKYNLEDFKNCSIRGVSKNTGKAGVFSVVKSDNGNRITIVNEIMEKLNNPYMLQIAFSNDSIAISEKIPNNDSLFNIRRSGNKSIIYSTKLVKMIAEMYELDFSNRTSITFYEVEYISDDEYTTAIIKIK